MRRTQTAAWLRANAPALQNSLVHGCAALVLALILWLNALVWPIPSLGLHVDERTGQVILIEPDSPADRAGVRIDDHVLRLYQRPWNALVAQPSVFSLISAPEPEIPITIERRTHGQAFIQTMLMHKTEPTLAFQIEKATTIGLALLCWATGYLLGIARRQAVSGSSRIALFWLAMGAVTGSYGFALYASPLLRGVLQAIMVAILVPFSVYIHLWFPRRTMTRRQAATARRLLFGTWITLTLGLVLLWVLRKWTLLDLVTLLEDVVPIAILIALLASGIVLWRTYRSATIAHVRRQIRLIALTCFGVAFGWLLTIILPNVLDVPALLIDQRTNLLIGAIPLAYLIGGTTSDLYRIDRVMMRFGMHALVSTLLVGLLAGLAMMFALHGPSNVLWMALCFVILYRPTQHMILRITSHGTRAQAYHALHAAITQLTTTLDPDMLNRELIAGVRSTFRQPALALYRADIDTPDQLTLVAQERFPYLAKTIAPGALIAQLCQLHTVTTSHRLVVGIDQQPLHADEEQTLRHPGVMVWGPIHHPHGALLGVLLLGARDDLDPYRTHDLHEIQRLLDAAALAFANSAAYTQQQHAEVTIRTLYQRLQEAQEATAAAIARELHDEIININVRLNIEAIQKVLSHIDDATLRAELELVLESEHTVIQALRLICEQLHPTGIDDPLGLPSVLRMQVARAQAMWNGICRLSVTSPFQPVAAPIQHAAMQITREALTNAIKHATAATHILVELRNVPYSDGWSQLIIRDDGQMIHPITAKPGHMGIRNMVERARMVGGQLQIDQAPDSGTAVVFTFLPYLHAKAEEPYDVPEVQQRS